MVKKGILIPYTGPPKPQGKGTSPSPRGTGGSGRDQKGFLRTVLKAYTRPPRGRNPRRVMWVPHEN